MRPGSRFMERARCFFTGDLIFTHVFNTQPQPGVPQRRWPVDFFLLEAAGCRIQTANPSVSESSNNICQVTSQQFSLTFVLEMDFILETSSKKAQRRFIQKECVTCACSQHIYAYFLCCHPRIDFWCSHHLISPSRCCYRTLKSRSFTALSCHFTASLTHSASPRTVSPQSPSQNVTQLSKSCPVSSTGILLQVTSWQLFSERGRRFPPPKIRLELEIHL